METILQSTVEKILESGPMGIALIVILATIWWYNKQSVDERKEHREQISAITKQCSDHHSELENKLVTMVKDNTEALTKSAATTENCAAAIKEIGFTLNSSMNLLTELSVMFKSQNHQ